MLTYKALELYVCVVYLILFPSTLACYPGGSRNGHRYNAAKIKPLRRGETVPDISEVTIAASGPSKGPIVPASPRYNKLVENFNSDIVFANGHRDVNVRRMTKECQDRLKMLSIYVRSTWPSVRLLVFRSFQVKPFCKPGSLHCEGRAVDFTTDDNDNCKNGYLARLAVNAGFNWVHYDLNHIHASVRDEESNAAVNGGCFPGSSTVLLQNGTTLHMNTLSVGDKILAVDRTTGKLVYSEVLSFLDKQPKKMSFFLQIKTKTTSFTLTSNHMLFASNPTTELNNTFQTISLDVWGMAKPVHASNVKLGLNIFIMPQIAELSNTTILSRIVDIQYLTMAGAFAPLTQHGTLVVDGTVASCYAVVKSEPLAHAALYPMRTIRFLSKASKYQGVHWYAQKLLFAVRAILPPSLFCLI